ncbi:hypothetical protein [uncultured Selenomonas sp.]|uniref:hypothetical protein n=1 Tax=uncultured Selenomonas sp. TaxID=159275 RepID=UPI0025D08C45|nr:hypothetical protein [uncultured Selenomonas sp.]
MNSNKSSQQMNERLKDSKPSVVERVKKFNQMLTDFGEMMRSVMADGDGLTAGQASMRHVLRGRL